MVLRSSALAQPDRSLTARASGQLPAPACGALELVELIKLEEMLKLGAVSCLPRLTEALELVELIRLEEMLKRVAVSKVELVH